MARIDDYIKARSLAVSDLSNQTFETLLNNSGFQLFEDNNFKISFLDKTYIVSYPDFNFQKINQSDDNNIPIQEQILILHYLIGINFNRLLNQWVSYREIKGASFYFQAFKQRAIEPLKKVFSNNFTGFIKSSEFLKGKKIDYGDLGFEFFLFPKVPVQLILWQGDDEFDPEANILFDKSIENIFSPEDVAWLASMIVYRLISIAK